MTKVSDEWDVPDKSNTDLLRPVWKALAPSSTEAEVAAAEISNGRAGNRQS